ncbi:MAG: DUF2505 domain-containing protein [Proteobacteria bacterium]|nr:DUF2505 domain-containing protein [Pseudomonadota bacterium]
MKLTYKHTIPASVDQVMDAYRSSEFYAEKQKSLGAISVEILEWEELEDGVVRSKSRITEPSRQPAFIRKSDVDTFIDEDLLDPKARTLTWKITPSIGADKFLLKGVIEFQEDGKDTHVVYNIELRVKIPLIGAKIEKFALGKTEEETAAQAAFLKKWLEKSDT